MICFKASPIIWLEGMEEVKWKIGRADKLVT